jgi:hypothetical protein
LVQSAAKLPPHCQLMALCLLVLLESSTHRIPRLHFVNFSLNPLSRNLVKTSFSSNKCCGTVSVPHDASSVKLETDRPSMSPRTALKMRWNVAGLFFNPCGSLQYWNNPTTVRTAVNGRDSFANKTWKNPSFRSKVETIFFRASQSSVSRTLPLDRCPSQ